jgi:hypothetical protein
VRGHLGRDLRPKHPKQKRQALGNDTGKNPNDEAYTVQYQSLPPMIFYIKLNIENVI